MVAGLGQSQVFTAAMPTGLVPMPLLPFFHGSSKHVLSSVLKVGSEYAGRRLAIIHSVVVAKAAQ